MVTPIFFIDTQCYTGSMLLFSRYANSFEKTVNKFFQGLRSSSNPIKTHQTLERLMQQDLIVVNLWMEKRFKNYTNLTTRERQLLYKNVQCIEEEFEKFIKTYQFSLADVQSVFASYQVPFPQPVIEQIVYCQAIMDFLKPGGRYNYIKTASFARLLQDPTIHLLEGDCNQIVTLYAYLYSRKFSLSDLNVKILPEHVCLHISGIDIEATNATFQNYKEYPAVMPITELIAINLLDVSDVREMTEQITEKTMLQGAKLAYLLSSNRELVARNLQVAYHNLALYAAKSNNFPTASFYADKTQDQNLLQYINHNGALYYAKQNNYAKARVYAKSVQDPAVRKYISELEANSHMKKGNYSKARYIYQQLNNPDMIKATYQSEYNALAKNVQDDKTISQMKQHKTIYNKMLMLAKKASLTQQTTQLQDLIKQLK